MGQIVSSAAKPKRCNLNQLSQVPTPAAGEYILVSSDNSMNAEGQGNFDSYIVGDGTTAAVSLTLQKADDLYKYMDSELHKSTNLLDKNACIENKYIDKNTGAEASTTGTYASPFIPVSENGLHVQKFYVGGVAIGGAVYDSSKSYLRSFTTASYTYQNGDGYIRFSIKNSTDLQTAMVNEGTTAKTYEAYYAPYYTYSTIKKEALPPIEVNVEDLTFTTTEVGRNLFDKTKAKSGKIVDKNSGYLVDFSGYVATDFIPLNGHRVSCPWGVAVGVGGCALYDSNKTFVRASDDVTNTGSDISGCAYARFTIKEDYINIASATYSGTNNTLFPYTPYEEKEVISNSALGLLPLSQMAFSTKKTGKNRFNKNTVTNNFYINDVGAYIIAEGALANTVAVSDYIPVSKNGLHLTMTTTFGGAYWKVVDANYNNIRILRTNQYEYQDGDAYIQVSLLLSELDTIQIEEGTSGTSYEAYTETDVISPDVLPEQEEEVVGIENLSFSSVEIGKNLFDKTKAKSGKIVDKNSGYLVDFSGYVATDFIPLNGHRVSCPWGVAVGVGGCALYDSSKSYVRDSGSPQGSGSITGCAYARFTIEEAYIDEASITYCDESTTLFPYTEYEEKTVIPSSVLGAFPLSQMEFASKKTGKNRFDKNAVTKDFYIDDQGFYYPIRGPYVNTMAVSDYIPVSKNGLYLNMTMDSGGMWSKVVDADYNNIRLFRTKQYEYQEGDAYIQVSLLLSELDTIQIEEGTSPTTYEAYTEKESISPDVLPDMDISEENISSALSGLGVYTNKINVFLPDTIHAVVGDTLQVFFKSLIQAVEPLRYNVLVACTKGAQYHRYWEYTPAAADVGTTTFKVTVKDDNGNILGSAQCNLVTVAAATSPSSSMNVLCVGDSTTAGGQWVSELKRRLTGSGGTPTADGLTNISFVGSIEKSSTKFEGHSGWAWSDYTTAGRGGAAFRFYLSAGTAAIGDVYSNNSHNYEVVELQEIGGVDTILCSTSSSSNTPSASGTLTKVSGTGDSSLTFTSAAQDSANPFWDSVNEEMTFVPYAETYCEGEIDVVYVLLGGNGQSAWRVDFSTMMAQVKTFADTLHSEFPNAKLKLMSYALPSMVNMMKTYGASGSGYADTYGTLVTLFRLQQEYQDFANQEGYEFVEFIALGIEFDTDYNYPLTMKDVNTRNSSVKEPYDNNTLHPSNDGYYQYADAVYRNFVAEFCQ